MQFRENRSVLSQARASLLKTAVFVVAMLAITGAVFSLFSAAPVLAQTQDFGLGAAQTFGLPTMDLRQIIVNIIRAALGLLGMVAVIIVLYAGFQWMIAGDDAKKVENSKKTMINGAIGLLIIVSAYTIVSFIFSALGYGGFFGGNPNINRGGEPGGFGGALGNGPIQSHYPPRNAVDVPRNTSIIVTFKEAIDPATVTSAANSVEIVTREVFDAGGTLAPLTAINIGHDSFNKTFVFTPIQYLGSPDHNTGYVVSLGSDIKKADGKPVFSGRFLNYIWSFEVSNKLDVIPPTVTSVIPLYSNPLTSEAADENPHNNTVARNAIIQINFSEAVNPLAVSGEAKFLPNGDLSFNNIIVANLVLSNNSPTYKSTDTQNSLGLTGRFEISNQYRTVEFTTDQECGVNSCGEKVYCLPGNSQIQVFLKSATLTAAGSKNPDLPFLAAAVVPSSGVTDVANNSLDGNKDSKPDDNIASYNLNLEDPAATHTAHPAGDNYQWGFYTNNTVDLVPPTVLNYSPVAKAVGVQPTQQLTATFDKYLSASTIKPDAGYGDGYCGCTSDAQCISSTNVNLNERCNTVKGYCEKVIDSSRIICHKHTDGAECQPLPPVAPATTAPADQDETLCIEHEHVALLQPENVESVGYYLMSQNDPNPMVSQSTSILEHVDFLKNQQYGAYYGSGIRDLFQNCYIPNAAPGCPRVGGEVCNASTQTAADAICEAHNHGSVCQPNKTCSYVNAPDWLGVYPTCDLTLSKITTYGQYNLGYATPVSQINKTLLFSSFAWTKDAGDLVSSLDSIDYFKDFSKKDLASTWLYFQQGATQGSGDLYLISYAGRTDSTVSTSVAHNISFTVSSTNPSYTFSNSNLVAKANATAVVAPASLKLSFDWDDKTSAYAVYKLGTATQVTNLNLQISRDSVAGETVLPVAQWQTIYPGGRQIMDLATPVTISALDTQAPLVKSGDFKVQYSKTDTDYVVIITLDAKQYSDLAEAYVDWIFPENTVPASYNLNTQPLNDLGRNGDSAAGDSIWSYEFLVPVSATEDVALAISGSAVTLSHSSKDYAGNKVRKDGGALLDAIPAEISVLAPPATQ